MKWVWRILGGIVGLFVLCFLGLLLYSMRPNHGVNSAEVVIDRPAAQVWRYITDDSLVLKWVTGLGEIHHHSGPVGAVGEVLRMSESANNQKIEMEMEITAFETNRRIGFKLRSLGDPNYGFTEDGEYFLEETNGKTRLRLSGKSEYFGFVFKLLEPVITPSAQKKLLEDLNRMKRLVEAEPVMTAAPEKP